MNAKLTVGLLARAERCHTMADRATERTRDPNVILLGLAEANFWATLALISCVSQDGVAIPKLQEIFETAEART